MLGRPRAPMDGWPIQVADERFGFAWYCPGGFVVAQPVVAHATEEAAAAYLALEDLVLEHRAAEVQRHGGMHAIHDWRAVGSYTSDARRLWRKRMQERGRGYLRASTVCVRETTPLLKMAVQGANMLAALSLGARIEMVEDLRETFRVLDVEPPPAGTPFPGRAAGPP